MIRLLATIAALASGLPQARSEWVQAKVTAYSPTCPHCTGKRHPDGIGAAGVRIVPGQMLAADKGIPFGTRVLVQGSWWTVQDRGRAVKAGKLDLALPSHREAKAFGVQREKVWIERP